MWQGMVHGMIKADHKKICQWNICYNLCITLIMVIEMMQQTFIVPGFLVLVVDSNLGAHKRMSWMQHATIDQKSLQIPCQCFITADARKRSPWRRLPGIELSDKT